MGDAAGIATALWGHRCGDGWVRRCPVPLHGRRRGDHHPSLFVKDGDAALVVECYTGCSPRDVLDELLRRRLLVDEQRPDHHRHERRHQDRNRKADRLGDDAERARRARRSFDQARDVNRTPGWLYLQKRGVAVEALPDGISGVLRWHPACPIDGGTHPCLVASWTDARTGEARAIHRRRVSPTGERQGHWRALGPTAGCVIRLWPDDTVAGALCLGEGLETTLGAATRVAHRGTLLQPAWAAGDRGHMAAFPLLPGIEALTLLVDNDPGRMGQKAAAECTRRWISAGREVIRLTPRVTDSDFADIVGVSS